MNLGEKSPRKEQGRTGQTERIPSDGKLTMGKLFRGKTLKTRKYQTHSSTQSSGCASHAPVTWLLKEQSQYWRANLVNKSKARILPTSSETRRPK